MPRGNRTGPMGMGPMTGRGAGFCAGYDTPGYINPMNYRGGMQGGMRQAWGRRGGYNMGFGRGRGMHYAAYAVPTPVDITPKEKLDILSTREVWLKEQLEEVRGEMGTIQGDAKKETTD